MKTAVPAVVAVDRYIGELTALRAEMLERERLQADAIDALPADRRASARNLIHYLALRRHDLRGLPTDLAALGLSSLGRAESHVLATVDAVLAVLHALAGRHWTPRDQRSDFDAGSRLLASHAEQLLGEPPAGRSVRIMVTMPSEAADDANLVRELLGQGMNCLRINCAHDGQAQWARMIAHLRSAEQALGVRCHVLMDLTGPKPRTAPLAPGPAVLKIRPQRDSMGRLNLVRRRPHRRHDRAR